MVTLRRLVSNKTGLLTKSLPSIKHHGLTSSTEVISVSIPGLHPLEVYQKEVVVGLKKDWTSGNNTNPTTQWFDIINCSTFI